MAGLYFEGVEGGRVFDPGGIAMRGIEPGAVIAELFLHVNVSFGLPPGWNAMIFRWSHRAVSPRGKVNDVHVPGSHRAHWEAQWSAMEERCPKRTLWPNSTM